MSAVHEQDWYFFEVCVRYGLEHVTTERYDAGWGHWGLEGVFEGQDTALAETADENSMEGVDL